LRRSLVTSKWISIRPPPWLRSELPKAQLSRQHVIASGLLRTALADAHCCQHAARLFDGQAE
jgi:hypothetical protein